MQTGPCPSRFTPHVSLLTFHSSRFTSPFDPRGGESCSPARCGRQEAGFVTGDYVSPERWVSILTTLPPHQPHLRDLTPTPIPSKPRLPVPPEGQLPAPGGLPWDRELDGADGGGLVDERVDL